MKLPQPYQCNYCERLQKATDRWWMLDLTAEHFVLRQWDNAIADERLPDRTGERFEHICSSECAVKALAKFMSLFST